MRAVERTLELLYEATDSFVISGEERVLHLLVSHAAWLPTLQVLASFEHHPANVGPWFFNEATDDPLGWDARAEEIELQWLPRTEEGAVPLFPLLTPVMTRDSDGRLVELAGLPRFVARIKSASALLADLFEELIIVLAPPRLRDPVRWANDLRNLLLRSALTRVRFVVVDIESPVSADSLTDIPGVSIDLRLEPTALLAEQRSYLQATESAVSAATDEGGALTAARIHPIGAGPDVEPPLRQTSSRIRGGEAEQGWRSAGIPTGLFPNGTAHTAQLLALRAGLALLDEKPGAAAELQGGVSTQLEAAGLFSEAGASSLLHAVYCHRAGEPDRAEEILRATLTRADHLDDPLLSAKAEMVLAGLKATAGEYREAAEGWARAGVLAARAGSDVVAVEAWRTAGQAYYALGRESDAQDVYEKAVALVETDRERAPYTSAAEAALALATLLYESGDPDEAFRYRGLAETLSEPRE